MPDIWDQISVPRGWIRFDCGAARKSTFSRNLRSLGLRKAGGHRTRNYVFGSAIRERRSRRKKSSSFDNYRAVAEWLLHLLLMADVSKLHGLGMRVLEL